MPASLLTDVALWAPWTLGSLAAVWVLYSAVTLLALLAVRTLPRHPGVGRETPEVRSAAAVDAARPSVTVIVPARNEQARIRDTVERLLSQEGVDLELTIVDDRSTDTTPAILEALRRKHSQLRVMRIDDLPEGWLGKPHACYIGAGGAGGDWLLFSDADAWIGPDVVARAIGAARREGVEHVAVYPGEDHTTLPARAAMTLIMSATAWVPALVNLDAPYVAVGVGAFNLVRADAYRKAGGYERLRMEVIDDLKLGAILRRAGMRTRVYDGSRDLKVHWAGSLGGLVRAVEKNMFALFGFNVLLAAVGAVLPLALWSATLLAPLLATTLGPAAFVPLVGMATTWIPAWVVARRGKLGLRAAFLCPLAVPVMSVMIGHSTLTTLRHGGIRWRKTFYPLSALRRGRV